MTDWPTKSQWKIEASGNADTKEAAIVMFEMQVAALRESNFSNQASTGFSCVGDNEGYSRSVVAPYPLPLTRGELDRLRKLLEPPSSSGKDTGL